ncbi:MAG: YjgB family protein [Clostridia bacterium]
MRRTRKQRTFPVVGTGIAVVAILGAVWMGTFLLKQDEQATPSAVIQKPDGSKAGPDIRSGEKPTENDPSAPTVKPDSLTKLLQQQLKLAEQGRVDAGGIALETTMLDSIEQQWGKPDQTRFENGLNYATYTKRGLDIGANKGMQVVEIRYQNPALKHVTPSDVEKALGAPHSIRTTIEDQKVYVYKPNEKYELQTIFAAPNKQTPSATLQSIVVRYPQGMINMMAEESPADLILHLKESARRGKLPDVPVTVGKSMRDQVEREWGKSGREEMIKGLRYSVYPQKNIVLVSNKGDQIIETRSYLYLLTRLKQSEVRQGLGKPVKESSTAGQTIDLYQISPDYQLKIVYPAATKEIPDPTIDHINLLYPKGFGNQMAQ